MCGLANQISHRHVPNYRLPLYHAILAAHRNAVGTAMSAVLGRVPAIIVKVVAIEAPAITVKGAIEAPVIIATTTIVPLPPIG